MVRQTDISFTEDPSVELEPVRLPNKKNPVLLKDSGIQNTQQKKV